MSTITPILYFDGALRLTRHGAGKGETVLLHVLTGLQVDLPDADTAVVSAVIERSPSADEAYNAVLAVKHALHGPASPKAYATIATEEDITTDAFELSARKSTSATHARTMRGWGRLFAALVDKAIADGMTLDLNDGEETVLRGSTDRAALLAAAFSTDWDYLTLRRDGEKFTTLFIVYDGLAEELISDYSGRDLETISAWLAPINALGQAIDEGRA